MAINYPVSQSDRFVLYRVSDNFLLCKDGQYKLSPTQEELRVMQWPRADGQPIPDMEPGFAPAIVVIGPAPAFDSLTHKLVLQGTLVPASEEYQVTKVVTPLSQAELDAIAEAQAKTALKNKLKNAVTTLRAWETQAQGVTVTQGNAVVVLQTTVDRNGQFYGFMADLLVVLKDDILDAP